MMTPEARIRALVDKLNKTKASRPPLPTGAAGRSLSELVNTGAQARNYAAMTVKKPQAPGAPQPLAELIRKMR